METERLRTLGTKTELNFVRPTVNRFYTHYQTEKNKTFENMV